MKIFLSFLSFALFAVGTGEHLTSMRNALLADGWRTTAQVDRMSFQDKRDALISEIMRHSKTWRVQFFNSLNERQLIDMVEVILFLKTHMHKTVDELKEMRFIDQRNALITELNNRMELDGDDLNGKTNQELVEIGDSMVAKGQTVAEVVGLTWQLDLGTKIESVPEIIVERLINNCIGIAPIESTLGYKKTITRETSFQTTDTINWKIGATATFSAGIPFIAEAEVETSFEVGGQRTWTYGGKNTISREYNPSTKVSVPVGKRIKLQVSMKIDKIRVPYTMHVKTEMGTTKQIHGVWNGVTIMQETTTQENLHCD